MLIHKPLLKKVQAAPAPPAASWLIYHRLQETNPRAARAYFAKHEKQLSPAFKLNKQKP